MTTQISIPSVVLGLQGALNTTLGLYGVVRPTDWVARVAEKLGGTIPPAVGHTLSLQLLNMGLFTLFAASRPSLHRRALIARAFVHILTGYLFLKESAGLRDSAWTEIGFGVVNVVALLFVRGTGVL